MSVDAWAMLKVGAKDEALRHMTEAYLQKGTPSDIMRLGVAYLWAEDYRSAWEHFLRVNEQYPKHADDFYAMAGAAQWCLGKPCDGVNQWTEGLACQYTDWARVTLPLLLYFASVVKPSTFSLDHAKRLLTNRAKDDRIQKWPGPIAQFVLDQLDEDGLRRNCEGFNDRDTALRNWKADFYLAVVEHARGNVERYSQLLQKCTTMSDDEFATKRDTFLGKLWAPEFFLARHELSRIGVSPP
jgi:lipoprotein NlpI